MNTIKQFFGLLRLSHWSKGFFVFWGVIYSGSLDYLPTAILAALAFCLIASAGYIYNDFQDREADRLHPHKHRRPLASGDATLSFAFGTFIFLLVSGLALGWSVSSKLAALLGVYLLINLAYSHILKNLPVFNMLCVASGYMLRVLAGTIGIGLPLAPWLAAIAILLSGLIAICKRRLEKQLKVKHASEEGLFSGRAPYQLDFLIALLVVSCFTVYLSYIFVVRDQSFYFLLTLPFFAIGLWRFSSLATKENSTDDPVAIFFSDSLSRFNLLCFLVLTFIAIRH
ncbi:decaprenyl-phosphate phosphoribosyltransferase [Legionella dresdenensis]|uniref:Decaprenyl-phosphate phosphoribosyltransferase n=1 Tax=Legionella dresdenensis TaxID=450200 RepID=A0ABV8CH87_9GAMM